MISDKGSVFMSPVIKEIAEVLGISLQHATTKHAQTFGMLERMHVSLKKLQRLKQVEEAPCGTKMSTLQFRFTTPLTTQALDVNLVECFTGVFHTMY